MFDGQPQPPRAAGAEHQPIGAAREFVVRQRFAEVGVVGAPIVVRDAALRHARSAAGFEDVERLIHQRLRHPATDRSAAEPFVFELGKFLDVVVRLHFFERIELQLALGVLEPKLAAGRRVKMPLHRFVGVGIQTFAGGFRLGLHFGRQCLLIRGCGLAHGCSSADGANVATGPEQRAARVRSMAGMDCWKSEDDCRRWEDRRGGNTEPGHGRRSRPSSIPRRRRKVPALRRPVDGAKSELREPFKLPDLQPPGNRPIWPANRQKRQAFATANADAWEGREISRQNHRALHVLSKANEFAASGPAKSFLDWTRQIVTVPDGCLAICFLASRERATGVFARRVGRTK